MADSNTIYISLGNISNSSLNNATSELEKALGYLRSLDSMDSQQYEDADGEMQFLFDGELAANAHASATKIERILSKLEEYNKLLTSGPEALADVDASSKIPNAISHGVIQSIIAGIITDIKPIEPKEKKIVEIRDYGKGVKRGTIRYVYQNKDLANNGWGIHEGIATGQCNSAVESMALSYLGIDMPPQNLVGGELLGAPKEGDEGKLQKDHHRLSPLEVASNPDGGDVDMTAYTKDVEGLPVSVNIHVDCYTTRSDINNKLGEMVTNFENHSNSEAYDKSPVIIHYKKDNNNQHWIMITGKKLDENGNVVLDKNGNVEYSAIGPWSNERNEFTITIGNDGVITRNGEVLENYKVNKIAQYTRTD